MAKTDWVLARGYQYSGVHCGLRPDPERLDLALVLAEKPATAAGVFTQNRVAAAPVQICRERLPSADARGIVICSGNANACTGQRGLEDARRMAATAAEAVGCRNEQMLVCSTGVIGHPLPMPIIEAGIHAAAKSLSDGAPAFQRAAQAILTTDTCIKVSTRSTQFAGGEVRFTGFAKGAAMIGPNMATMLAFVVTDAGVPAEHLAKLSRLVAEETFNCVRVEGHTSTNDTLLILANGMGPQLSEEELNAFDQSAIAVCTDLARAIAVDAEGAKHLVTIQVEGLRDDLEARLIAKAVSDSPLVKTAIYGADPNWGRIVSAAGYAGVNFKEAQLSLWLGDMPLYQDGTPLPFDAATASAYLKNNREVLLRLRFSLGTGHCIFWTCDLTPEYIRLNADYTT